MRALRYIFGIFLRKGMSCPVCGCTDCRPYGLPFSGQYYCDGCGYRWEE